MPKPIVLVHGGWFGGWCWRDVAKPLRAAGHEVHAPSLTGTGDRVHLSRPGITVETIARDVANLLEYEDLRDAVIVGTSNGGHAAARAAEMVPDRIGHLILLDALIPGPGQAAIEVVPTDWKALHDEETDAIRIRPDSLERLMNQLEPEKREWVRARLTTFPLSPFMEKADLTRFWQGGWPATVVFCERTVNPAEPVQRLTAERLKAAWRTLDAGHYPFLTHPEELARIILEIANG